MLGLAARMEYNLDPLEWSVNHEKVRCEVKPNLAFIATSIISFLLNLHISPRLESWSNFDCWTYRLRISGSGL